MPHELDTERSFISAREPAWHRLGIVKDGWFTAQDALAEAMLGYEVNKARIEAVYTDPDGNEHRMNTAEWVATIRQHPETAMYEIMGIVGSDYQIVQNAELFRFMDEVVGNIGGAHYETAGALRKGRQVFLSVSTESADIVLDAAGVADRIKTYILAFSSHDGSLALTVMITPVRVVCANTLSAAIGRSVGNKVQTGRWVARHTTNVESRVQEAKRTLGIYKDYTELMTVEAEKMLQTPLHDDVFTRVLKDLFVVDEADVKDADREAMDKTRALYELSPTCERITGTVWGGLQSVIEYNDWLLGVRGSKLATVNEMRFRTQMNLDGRTDLKQRAWDQFADLAKVG